MIIQKMILRYSTFLLSLCALAVSPTFAQTIITHVPLYTFDDDSGGRANNYPVSDAGDVNGDGFADLIVGAPGLAFSDGDIGSARVYSGVDGSVLYTFDGDSVGDQFGFAVSGAGDVNGDGFSDLIVGAYLDGRSGSARVFSGADGSVLYNFDGDSASDFFGYSVSGAGDVNGDGFADLIVGAYLDDNNGSQSGSARVFSGIDGSVLYNFDGDSADDFFGGEVSGAGDVNDDGFADLIVGAIHDDNNGSDSGSARVFSGVDGSVLYNFDGDSERDWFGSSVSGAGDVNGDGFADLIVGAPADDNIRTNSGNVRVFSGSDGSILYNLDGDSRGQLGISVSGTGDVNGDGIPDLIAGAYRDDFDRGSARVFSGSDGSVLYDFDGDSTDDGFGNTVSGAGDVNGDGVADFIVGNSRRDYGTRNYARLFVSQITILGDCDQNGVVNFLDISPFIGILSSGSFLKEGDVNQDDEVNFLDISPFVGILAGN